MKIQEFKTLVQRTLPDLGSLLLNSIHMTLGMGSEIMEELTLAFQKKDKVNISEELADAQWYGCNYATMYEIEFPDVFLCVQPQFASRRERKLMYDLLRISIGRLQDYDKKELCYGKKDILPAYRSQTLYDFMTAIEFIALDRGIDMDDARQKVINKLSLRYLDKFDADEAINRDVVAERKVLEGGATGWPS